MARFRAAIITDVHYGTDKKDKLGTKAPRLTRTFLKAAIGFNADSIIDLGDRIEEETREKDRENLKSYCAIFKQTAIPYHGVIGNHDDKNMSRAEHAEICKIPEKSYTFDYKGYHLVFWNPNRYVSRDHGIHIDQESMDWLKETLGKTDKPVILSTHVPLDNLDDEETQDIYKYFFWTEGKEIRNILEDAGNVILCLSGHRHRDRHREINGIHYITINSLVDTWKKHYRVPRGTFALMEVSDDRILIDIKGKTPKTYNLTPKSDAPKPH